MPRYEFQEGSSHKFWEITLEDRSFTTRYGKVGADGQSTVKSWSSPAEAKREYDKLVASKVKKGYELVEDEGDESDEGASAAAGAAAKTATNPELEAAIEADLDNPEAYLVYGDWLQAQGDRRGELIALQHAASAASGEKAKELKKSEAALLRKLKPQLLGELAKSEKVLKLSWQRGFLHAARIALDYDFEGDGMTDLTRALLALPSARFLQELTFGLFDFEGGNNYQPVIDLLVEVGQPKTLRSLFIGDFDYPDETEMSWSHVGDTSKLYGAFPGLRRLVLQGGGEKIALGEIVLPELRHFEMRSGGLGVKVVRSIAGARWPKIEHLEIWFGSEGYGADAGVKDIQRILDGVGLPNLKYLGLKNFEFAEDLCRALPEAKVLKQLETLDISMGTLDDACAAILAANKRAFEHLAVLKVDDNLMSKASKKVLAGAARTVEFGEQRDYGEDYRYASVGE